MKNLDALLYTILPSIKGTKGPPTIYKLEAQGSYTEEVQEGCKEANRNVCFWSVWCLGTDVQMLFFVGHTSVAF